MITISDLSNLSNLSNSIKLCSTEYEDVAYCYEHYFNETNRSKYLNYNSWAFYESLCQLDEETKAIIMNHGSVVLHHVCQNPSWGFKTLTIIKNRRVMFGYYVIFYHERTDHRTDYHLFWVDYETEDFETVWKKIHHLCECNQ